MIDEFILDSDQLHVMFAEQLSHLMSELKRYGYDGPLTPEQVNDLHLRLCHHLSSEVDEVLQCADWKIHRRGSKASTRSIATECVDVFKFLMNIMLIHGISPSQFFDAFQEKSKVVRARVMWEKARDSECKVFFVCDLDGILCDRDTALLASITAETGAMFSTVRSVKEALTRAEYEVAKRRFYESGGFLDAEPIRENIAVLRGCNAPILIVTSRDVKRYPNIEAETHEWLRLHKVPHAAVAFGLEKDREVMWIDRRSVAIDDEAQHWVEFSRVCQARRYNYPPDLVKAVDTMNETWSLVEKQRHAS